MKLVELLAITDMIMITMEFGTKQIMMMIMTVLMIGGKLMMVIH